MKLRKCLECGKEFEPKNGFQKYCSNPHIAKCIICGKLFEYACRPSEKPQTCSRECQTALQHKTSKEKYGVDNVSQIPGVYEKKKIKQSTHPSKIRICKWCGKEFYGHGTASYCTRVHYNTCAVCGKQFEVNPRQPKSTCSNECKQHLIQEKLSKKLYICAECGKEFKPRSSQSKYCDGPHYKPCKICGKLIEYTPGSAADSANCCSTECSNSLRKQTSRRKYEVDNPLQTLEMRQKCKEKSIEVQEIRKNTCLNRFGVDNPAKSPQVKQKISKTVSSQDCQSKMQSTMEARYGVKFAAQNPETHKKASETRKLYTTDDGTAVDSSYELVVYNFCLRNNLDFNYQSVPVKYEYQGKQHTTIIDFEIEGQLFEVKGSHLLEGCFDYAHVPISVKLGVYKKNHIVVITDSSAREMFGKPNSKTSNGLKYLDKCPEPLIGVDIALFDSPEFPYKDDRPKCFYDVKVDGQRSSFEAFQDEHTRWSMIMNRIQYSGGFIDGKQVIDAMNVTRTCKQPSWFSKNLAKELIQKYCTSDVIVDPFAGWGTRAQAADELDKIYIGGDFNRELVDWHHSKGYTNIKYMDANEFKYEGECSVLICPPYSNPETGRCFEDYNFDGFRASAKSLSQCDWLKIIMKNIPNAKEYVMVCKIVDSNWEKYIVDTKANKSHFGQNNEYILVIKN